MPASANCPERTLISPILTVPCACTDEPPNSSATAQPNPRTVRSMPILPDCFGDDCLVGKSVLTKNYAVESILAASRRDGFSGASSGGGPPPPRTAGTG